jgi:hypothetical protein
MKRGKAKNTKRETRRRYLRIRLTDMELERMHSLAEKREITVSELVRSLVREASKVGS